MTISKTLEKFEVLKEAIQRDGKVDMQETEVILDFIAPYCRASNRDFTELHRHLMQAREDNVITKEESDVLFNDLDVAADFLRKELKIERFMTGFIGLLLLGVIAWQAAKHFL